MHSSSNPAASPFQLRGRAFFAALLLIVSFGLPWGDRQSMETRNLPTWFSPGYCVNHMAPDGYMETDCQPGTIGGGLQTHQYKTYIVHGHKHPGRFGLAAGLVLIALAWRLRRPHYLMIAAAVVAVVSVMTGGFSFGFSGLSVAWLAVGLLASGVFRSHRWPRKV